MPGKWGKAARAALILMLLVASVTTGSRAGYAIPPNLVVNGTFVGGSSHTATGWTFTAATASSDFQYSSIATLPAPGGATVQAGFGATSSYYDMISQAIATQSGQEYSVQFYLLASGANGSVYSQFGTGADQFLLNGAGGPTTWTLEQYTYVATASSTTLTFGGYTPPGWYYVTDVSVQALPEPTHILLVGLLAMALMAVQRAFWRGNGALGLSLAVAPVRVAMRGL